MRVSVHLVVVTMISFIVLTCVNTMLSLMAISSIRTADDFLLANANQRLHYFRGSLITRSIRSIADGLGLVARKLHLAAKNSSYIHLADKSLLVEADSFSYRSTSGDTLSIGRGHVEMPFKHIRASGPSLDLLDALRTSSIRSGPGKSLTVSSTPGAISIFGPKRMELVSVNGQIAMQGNKDMVMESSKVLFKGRSVHLSLPEIRDFGQSRARKVSSAGAKRNVTSVFQVCACQDGRLFAAPPNSVCAADYTVCAF